MNSRGTNHFEKTDEVDEVNNNQLNSRSLTYSLKWYLIIEYCNHLFDECQEIFC